MVAHRFDIEIAAPFSTRLKTRLERAVAQAILNPSRALPTLRRAVGSATVELRRQQFTDAQIEALFTHLIEDVARARSLDSMSVVSQRPRWEDLTTKVVGWAAATE
jgi:hypothetical protein